MSKNIKLIVFSVALTGLLFIFIILPFANAGITPLEPQVQAQAPIATSNAYLPFIEKVATNFATGLARQTEKSFVTYGFLSLGGILGCVSVLLPFTGDNSSDQDEE